MSRFGEEINCLYPFVLGELYFFNERVHMARNGLHDLLESWVFTGSESVYYGIREIVFREIEHVISYQLGVYLRSYRISRGEY
jgi:hypothetical protein